MELDAYSRKRHSELVPASLQHYREDFKSNRLPKFITVGPPRPTRSPPDPPRPTRSPPDPPPATSKSKQLLPGGPQPVFTISKKRQEQLYTNFEQGQPVPTFTLPRARAVPPHTKTTKAKDYLCEDPACPYNSPLVQKTGIGPKTTNNNAIYPRKETQTAMTKVQQSGGKSRPRQQVPEIHISNVSRPSSNVSISSQQSNRPASYAHGTSTMDVSGRRTQTSEWPAPAWKNNFKKPESGNSMKGGGHLGVPDAHSTPISTEDINERYKAPSSLSGESGIGFTASNQSSNNSVITINQSSQNSTISTNSRSLRAANAATLLDPVHLYHQVIDFQESQGDSLCANCHSVIQNEKVPEVTTPSSKVEGSWNFSHRIHHPIQRNNSIGSGFTLTGQDTRQLKRSRMSKFCSSHKIALVVSTFSFLVTIGLTITLILMKNKGMMEPM